MYLLGMQYETQKMTQGRTVATAHGGDGKFTINDQSGNLRSSDTAVTALKIAKEHKVGRNTVLRAEKYAKSVQVDKTPV